MSRGPANRRQARPGRRPDVLTLVIGLVITVFAGAALVMTMWGGVAWEVARMLAPMTLITIGVIGIMSSQRRARPAAQPVVPRPDRSRYPQHPQHQEYRPNGEH